MDIVERLRKLVIFDEVGSDNPLGRDAADEIERLREELRTIRDVSKDVEKSYAELFAEVKTEARSALQQKERK
jgi:predicted RND superfamily exporter protein